MGSMYQISDFRGALDKRATVAGPVSSAVQESKDASAHAKACKATLRDQAAIAVSIGFLIGLGKPAIIAEAKARLDDSKAKAVRISETLGVLDNWQAPKELAEQWAAADFSQTSVV